MAWQALIQGGWEELSRRYVFDVRPLTNDRPYFAAYIKPGDLLRITDRLEAVQDEWGYLLLWATLFIAAITASTLIAIPVVFGWRTVFSRAPGKGLTIVYFACLGLGYIMIEVGHDRGIRAGAVERDHFGLDHDHRHAGLLRPRQLRLRAHPAPRADHHADWSSWRSRALLVGYGLFLHIPLDAIGTYPYAQRLFFSFLLVFPPAFLMGFPMPTAMATLARLKKEHMFLWAWGINGCFSVIGAAVVPIVATAFGLSSVLFVGAAAYLIALPAFFAILVPVHAPLDDWLDAPGAAPGSVI